MASVQTAPHDPDPALTALLGEQLGTATAALVQQQIWLPRLARNSMPHAATSRGIVAQALTACLWHDLLQRVPLARRRVDEIVAGGGRVVFDHGALRTVQAGASAFAGAGARSFVDALAAVGYRVNGIYPLDGIGMTGFALCHADHPDTVPQVFVSELHLERFSSRLGETARRLIAHGTDPLTKAERALLRAAADATVIPRDAALRVLRLLLPMFARHHAVPTFVDYCSLLDESAEMAWIATEGSVFNHVTERVGDVAAVAAELRMRGYPLKPTIEVSASGTVRQTALLAGRAPRRFADAANADDLHGVPGSFYEFIERRAQAGAAGHRELDLRFDSGNAQGIFAVTSAR